MGKSISKTIEITGVGKVLLEKSRHAKRLSITIRPFQGARVAVPLAISFKKAELFAASKGDWLKKHNTLMSAREQEAVLLVQNVPIQKRRARRRIVERLADLSAHSGLTYNRVFVRSQKTRWGSCSHQNNISLNINLVRLPPELMDYVILHELVHTRVKNHGPLFWSELAAHVPNPRALDRALNQYGALLVACEDANEQPS